MLQLVARYTSVRVPSVTHVSLDQTIFGYSYGDLGLDDIILDRTEKEISIIDFSDCASGDPAWDFWGLLSDSPRFAREVLLKYAHYDEQDDILGRAEAYNRMVPIGLMIHSFRGVYPFDFDDSYRKFKRLFRIGARS